MPRREEQKPTNLETENKPLNKVTSQTRGIETTLLAVLENTPAPVYLKDVHGKYLFVNRQYELLAHITRDKILGKDDFQIFPEEVASLFRSQDQDVIKQDIPLEFEETVPLEAGDLTFITSKFPVRDEHGKIYAVGGFCTDITERKTIEKSLQALEDRFRLSFHTSPDSININQLDGTYVEINQGFTDLTGYTREDVIGKSSLELDIWAVPADREKLVNALQRVGHIKNLESKFRLKNGSYKIGLMSATIITLQNEPHILSVTKDITLLRETEKNSRKLQAQLNQIQKLESLGVLAGGIGHDFNNLLSAIIGNIDLARLNIPPDSEPYRLLEEAENASLRARNLTQQLLTFSRGGEPARKIFTLTETVRDSADFILRGSNTRCEYDFQKDLPPIEADPGQIGQVIQNLIINSSHAMPNGGVIKIQGREFIKDSSHILPIRNGKYIRLTIKDQGSGIPSEHLGRLFDPYFTTKIDGSGLGLAVAHSIISRHQGHINVESKAGVGTTFTIYLPTTDKKPVSNQGHTTVADPVTKARILVMDDEELLLNIITDMLTHLGHEVITAGNGEDVIKIYRDCLACDNPIDLFILDLTIPGCLGGRETGKKIHEINPDVKVIIASGYSTDPVLANYQQYGFCDAIIKPFKLSDLSSAINKALANPDK